MARKPSRIFSAELEGVEARIIEVEADVHVGLHDFSIVGLADKSLNEAKERVNSAIRNTGIKSPNQENRKIIINLAPADFRKTGSQYDLAIAIGYLAATNQIKKFDERTSVFIGELALDGRLRGVSGALNIAERAAKERFKYLFLPSENAAEASVIAGLTVIPLETLREAIDAINSWPPTPEKEVRTKKKFISRTAPDFSEVKGQETAKRALLVALTGEHNICLIGPPGVGKSLLASACVGILPEPTIEDSIEITKIWSAAGLKPNGLIASLPFRAPHHTISQVALIGGGQDPKPGEISLAHRGILFLDELPEFRRGVIEALRQPLDAGRMEVVRSRRRIAFPAGFMLIAAMNPCPCGYYGDKERSCSCTAYEVVKYQKRISGPLLDRIDMRIAVGRVSLEMLRSRDADVRRSETETLRSEVKRGREIQRARFSKRKTNAKMTPAELRNHIKLTAQAERLLESIEASLLSPRSFFKILKVARTIADLDRSVEVSEGHLAEAFSYRMPVL